MSIKDKAQAMRSEIAKLGEDDKKSIDMVEAEIRYLIRAYGGHAKLAITLAAIELQAEEEELLEGVSKNGH